MAMTARLSPAHFPHAGPTGATGAVGPLGIVGPTGAPLESVEVLRQRLREEEIRFARMMYKRARQSVIFCAVAFTINLVCAMSFIYVNFFSKERDMLTQIIMNSIVAAFFLWATITSFKEMNDSHEQLMLTFLQG